MKPRKRIGIVARGLTRGGVTRFIVNILDEFDKLDGYNFYIFTDRRDFQERFQNLKIIHIEKVNKLWWDYLKSFFIIKKYKLDVILYPKNIIPFSHVFIPAKKINIIHDLAYFYSNLRAYKFWDTAYMRSLMKLSCKIADKIIAVSNNTKNDIEKILKINSNKIVVIYEAADKKYRFIKDDEGKRKAMINKYHLKLPYILYTGSLSPRKNISRLIKAFEKFKKGRNIPHSLILAGGKAWKEKENFNTINQSPYQNYIILTGFVADEDLPYFYNMANLCVYPSLYEGFGLPILEAQACGCPVLTSNTASCPEIAGKGAHIVNPYSIDDMKNGMLRIIKDNNYKEKLVNKGYENIKRFNWAKSAKQLLLLINDYIERTVD